MPHYSKAPRGEGKANRRQGGIAGRRTRQPSKYRADGAEKAVRQKDEERTVKQAWNGKGRKENRSWDRKVR